MSRALARPALALLLLGALASCEQPDPDRCRVTDLEWVAWSQQNGSDFDLYLSRPDGACLRPLATRPGPELQPVLSVARGVAVYVAVRGGVQQLVVQGLEDGAERVLATGDLWPSSPTLSPDGTLVAFQGWVGLTGQSDVWVVPLDGGDPVLVASSSRPSGAQAYDGGPAWGPGNWIYFLSDRTGTYQVHRTRPDGAEVELVTSTAPSGLGGILGRPAISPDGAALAFARTAPDSTSRVVIRTVATGEERILADVSESEPSFDASGRRVAVASYLHGLPDVVVRDLATGALLGEAAAGPTVQVGPAFAR